MTGAPGARLRGEAARPRLLPHRRRALRGGERELRAGDAAPQARRGEGGPGPLRLPRQERQAAGAGDRRPLGAADHPHAQEPQAAAARSYSPTETGTGWSDITSTDINEYLKELTGDEFTAKDFRTWNATVLAAVAVAEEAEHGDVEDGPQAGREPSRQGGRRVPQQHPRGLPLRLHRPAGVRPLRLRARRSAPACKRIMGRTDSGEFADREAIERAVLTAGLGMRLEDAAAPGRHPAQHQAKALRGPGTGVAEHRAGA